MMKFSMCRMVGKKLQIFRSIILFVFNRIYRIFYSPMMYNFYRSQISTKHFFHNQTRTTNITSRITKRVIRAIKKDISSSYCFATFPRRIFRAFAGHTHFLFSFFRSYFTFVGKTYFSFVFFRKFFTYHPFTIAKFLSYFVHNFFVRLRSFIYSCWHTVNIAQH